MGVAVILGFALASTNSVQAADNLIGHKVSVTKYRGVPAAGKLYSFTAKAGQNGNEAEFTLPTNPFHASAVQVQRDGGLLSDSLTAGAWKGLGNPLGSSGWKYTNKNAPIGGPVKTLLIRKTRISIRAKNLGTLPVAAATNGPIDTIITVDDQRYCARAESPHYKEIANRLIKSKEQLPPVACPACMLGVDSDGDRIDNCYETNTGVFVSPTDTGTDPFNADTDGDGIKDGDEILGTLDGLDLPDMGTSPLHRDILIEYDWFDDSLECGPHSHRPTASAVAMVTAAFAAAPRANPDGTTGINVIHDFGQGGPFTGGNFIADADGVLAAGVNDLEFVSLKVANFAPNRNGYFHYVILPHRYDTDSDSSGQAELPGDDMIVSLYCAHSDNNVAHTIMHELGHNLRLRHGGFENCNYKPNYNSVMNYRYQFPGVDNNCTPPGDGVLDYSSGTSLILDEHHLDETEGICGTPGWDWNGNSVLESDVTFDINAGDPDEFLTCGGTLTTLRDYDDWNSLLFSGLSDSDGARLMPPEIIDCNPNPPLEAQ